ncbi:hypothetical protein Q7P37_010848 [Cladosporium fusiforme]
MLSLPLIPPQDDHSGWLRTSYRPRADSPPPSNPQTAAQNPQQHRQNRQNRQLRDEEKRQQQARSPLALLAADEAAIAQRKAAIRNFGAYWIRPPGVPKTLQAMNEEEQERREQEEIERRERGMLDMQAQQQLAEAQQRGAEAMAEQEDPDAPEERDLDDDIPEAEITGDVTEEDLTGDVTEDHTVEDTFNEDSMMEGSMLQQEQYAELEEAELTGVAQEEEDLGIEEERDLDDDVPDAGSYQHTDTEEEDSSSEEESEVQDSFAQQSARRSARVSAQRQQQQQQQLAMQTPAMGSLQERMRAQVGAADSLPRSPGSVNLSSSILESSFIGSSPMMQRANQGGRGRGAPGRRVTDIGIFSASEVTELCAALHSVKQGTRTFMSTQPPVPTPTYHQHITNFLLITAPRKMYDEKLEHNVSSSSGHSQLANMDSPPPPPYTSEKAVGPTPSLFHTNLKNKPITLTIHCTLHEPISAGPESPSNPLQPMSKDKFTITVYPSTTFDEFKEIVEWNLEKCTGVSRRAISTRVISPRPGFRSLVRSDWEDFKEREVVRQHCSGESVCRVGRTDVVIDRSKVNVGKGINAAEAVEKKSAKGRFILRVVKKVFKLR